jgi:hypothetical protein
MSGWALGRIYPNLVRQQSRHYCHVYTIAKPMASILFPLSSVTHEFFHRPPAGRQQDAVTFPTSYLHLALDYITGGLTVRIKILCICL